MAVCFENAEVRSPSFNHHSPSSLIRRLILSTLTNITVSGQILIYFYVQMPSSSRRRSSLISRQHPCPSLFSSVSSSGVSITASVSSRPFCFRDRPIVSAEKNASQITVVFTQSSYFLQCEFFYPSTSLRLGFILIASSSLSSSTI